MTEKKIVKINVAKIKPNPEPKFESTAMPDPVDFIEKESSPAPTRLALDDAEYKPKTRTEHYQELARQEKILDEDYFELPNPLMRIIGLVIDLAFMALIIKVVLMSIPFELKLIQLFLNKYNLVFMFGEDLLVKILTATSIFLGLFFGVVIPAAFFNSSLGKKITNLKVRGEDRYTISISQAFQRELIWKPISIASVIGFILPFFDKKKKKSLHDRLSGTFVVKDT